MRSSWPASSLTPVRTWGVVFVAVFFAHVAVQTQGNVPVGMMLCWFVSNSAEALLGAGILRRFVGPTVAFDRFSQVVMFFLGAGLLAPFLSSFLDAAFVSWNQFGTGGYWEVWRVRFFANMLATLTIVPFILTTFHGADRLGHIRVRKGIEAGVAFGLLLAICWAVFVLGGPGRGTALVLLYAPFPLLVWAAVRFGPWGASASLLLYGGIAILGAVSGPGPFVDSSPRENALAIQLFLFISWMPVMSLAAFVRERRRGRSGRPQERRTARARARRGPARSLGLGHEGEQSRFGRRESARCSASFPRSGTGHARRFSAHRAS